MFQMKAQVDFSISGVPMMISEDSFVRSAMWVTLVAWDTSLSSQSYRYCNAIASAQALQDSRERHYNCMGIRTCLVIIPENLDSLADYNSEGVTTLFFFLV